MVRDQLLRSKLRLLQKDVNLPEHRRSNRVYISEHLASENARLLMAAKQLRSHNKYKFVLSRNGRTFVRKNENSEVMVITSAKQIAELLKSNAVNGRHNVL